MGIANHALAAKTYTDNGDGTVTDPTTGLMWMRCAMGQIWNGTTCTGAANTFTFDQANALTGTTTFASQGDWRVPNIRELQTIVDRSVSNPAMNLIFPDAIQSGVWSASADTSLSDVAWFMHFHNYGGTGFGGYKISGYQVRLVRSDTQSGKGQTLILPMGWNLLGNGWNQSLPVAELLGDKTTITTVWKWDTATSGWQFYTPSMITQELQNYAASKNFGVLNTVGAGEGFWVNVKKPFTVTLPNGGAILSVDFQSGGARALTVGWNLIAVGEAASASGFNSALSITPPVAGVVPQNLTTLWAWENSKAKWYFYSPKLDASSGTVLTDYIASKGYLDFTATNKLLDAGTGFWVNKP